jgi:hypothetical protein
MSVTFLNRMRKSYKVELSPGHKPAHLTVYFGSPEGAKNY